MRINLSEISVSFQAENQAESYLLSALEEKAEKIGVKTYRYDNRIDGGNEYGLGIYLKKFFETYDNKTV